MKLTGKKNRKRDKDRMWKIGTYLTLGGKEKVVIKRKIEGEMKMWKNAIREKIIEKRKWK